MIAYVVMASTIIVAIGANYIIDDYKKLEEERQIIKSADILSKKNKSINELLVIESSINTTNTELMNDSILLKNKPIVSRIVDTGDESEIINRYHSALKIALKTNPNIDVNCSILSATEVITEVDCLKVHDKKFDFYHKDLYGNVQFKVNDEKTKNYLSQIQANKYNLSTENVKNSDEYFSINKNYITVSASTQNYIKNNKSALDEKIIKEIEVHIKNNNYSNASKEILNYQQKYIGVNPKLASLYQELLIKISDASISNTTSNDIIEAKKIIQEDLIRISDNPNMLNTILGKNEKVDELLKETKNNIDTIIRDSGLYSQILSQKKDAFISIIK